MIDPAFVRNVATRGRSPANVIALALLHGDDFAEYPLRDCLEEQGVTNMTGLEIGKNYYIETVTKYYTGELVACDFSGITLLKACWIPDSGRYNECFKTGKFNEQEPLPKDRKLFLPAGVITSIVEWKHSLPDEVK